MSKDGLKKIYLIKSAGYEFVEIDIADNTLLLGESGVGKTTLMRAVLFFYTMDYSDTMLNLTSETKKSFNDWYFKEHNSHVVYEYTKDDNRYLFVVSKTSKLHYTFIDITNLTFGVKEIFIEKNKPINFEMLNEVIQKNSMPSYTTTIKDRYMNIFHKRDEFGKRLKTDSTIDFSLFEDIKSRKEFARTLSNIFASSSIKSTNIQKTIVSLIDNSTAKIALYDIKTNLNKFSSERKEIEKFEKKIPIIKELVKEYENYINNKKDFKKLSNQIDYIQKHSMFKIQAIDAKLDDKKREKSEQTQRYFAKQEMQEELKASCKTKLDIQHSKLEELLQKDKEFKSKNISYLLAEHNNEKSYKDEKVVLESRYEALTTGLKEIESRYSEILSKLRQSSNENKQKLEKELSIRVSEKKDAINSIIQNKDKRIINATYLLVEEKTNLEQKAKEFNKELINLNTQKAKIEYFVFNKEKISEYEDSIKTYDKKLMDTEFAINKYNLDIREIEKDIQTIKTALSTSLKTLNDNYLTSKDILLSKKQEIEKKLDFDSQNLYGYLNKNDVKNKEKIVTYLKDEILFDERKFSIDVKENDNSIFGLNVKFEEEFSNEYKQENLLKELNLVKTNIKDLNKKVQKEKHQLEDTATKQTKEKNLQRTLFYKDKEELEDNKKSYLKAKDERKIDLNEAIKDAKKLRNDEIKKVNEQLILLEESIQSNTQRVSFLTQKIVSETESINKFVDAEVQRLNQEIKELKLSNSNKQQELDVKLKDDEQKYELEKLDALKAKGVDNKVLDELLSQKKAIDAKLDMIEKNRQYISLYLSTKDELAKIPQKQEELKDTKVEFTTIKKQLESLKSEYQKVDALMLDAIKELEKERYNLTSFIDQYNQKIQNLPIQKTMQRVSILNFSMDINSVDFKLIDDLKNNFEAIQSNEKQIKILVLKSLKDLKPNNIFEIDVVTDFIEDIEYTKTALGLIEYIKNDKLTPLKDALSEQFKGEIRKITKELDIFDDALLDIKYQVKALANTIRKAVDSFNVIDSIEIRAEDTNNNLLYSLKSLSEFYDNNSDSFLNGLFDNTTQDSKKIKNELDNKILEFVELLNTSKEYLELEDGFVLEFKIVEKGNNLKWRQNIDDIGSNGTSTLVKSIINISMLQMVSKNIVKDTLLVSHCVLDEIGTISTDYFKELKEFVNRSGFVFLNGMPIEDDMLISMYPTIYVGQNYGSYSKMILASKMEI